MTSETLIDALGFLDDDIISEVNAYRADVPSAQKPLASGEKVTRFFPRRSYAAVAVCLCLVLLGAFVFQLKFGESDQGAPASDLCGAGVGMLVGDMYYGVSEGSVYRYSLKKGKEIVISEKHLYDYKVDAYAIYYTRTDKARSLFILPHDSSKSQVLYTADKDRCDSLIIDSFEEGTITLWLIGTEDANDMRQLVQLDRTTGEILADMALSHEAYNERNRKDEYLVGTTMFTLIGEEATMLRDGEDFLPTGTRVEYEPRYYGQNLLIRFVYEDQSVPEQMLLASPDGVLTNLPEGDYLAGTDTFLLFMRTEPNASGESVSSLYAYDIPSGETCKIHEDMDCYEAVTDGVLLYSFVPWNDGRTDCWRLVYDETGRIASLELVEADI